jgi:hypothetical protein
MFHNRHPAHHTIVEAHPQVLQHMRDTGVYDWPGVRILEGRWQDFFTSDKLGDVIEDSPSGFSAIFMDTFAEGYEGGFAKSGADQNSRISSRLCQTSWTQTEVFSPSGTVWAQPVCQAMTRLTRPNYLRCRVQSRRAAHGRRGIISVMARRAHTGQSTGGGMEGHQETILGSPGVQVTYSSFHVDPIKIPSPPRQRSMRSSSTPALCQRYLRGGSTSALFIQHLPCSTACI